MEYRIRTDLLRSAAVVALGVAASVVVSTAVAARAYRGRGEDALRNGRTLAVKGLARKRIRSDVAVWQIDVEGEGKSLREAFDVLKAGVGRVRAVLAKHGFPQLEVESRAIETNTHYARDDQDRPTRQVASYTLERSLIVTSGDVQRVAAAAGRVTELVRDDIRVVSKAPDYYFSGIAELKVELMGLASRDARSRAERIAGNAGCRVGAVQRAHMGVLQITRPHSTAVRSYGIYDTSTIEKDVRAVVAVTFGIENGSPRPAPK